MELLPSPRSWAYAGAPQDSRAKARGQGPIRDEAQVSLRKLHCASVPRAAAAVQTAGPSVCRLPSIAGSEAKARPGSEPAGPNRKGQLKETGDPVAWQDPRGGPPQFGGKHLFTCSHVALEPDQKPPRGNGRAGLTATLPTASREVRSSKYQVPAMPKMDAANQMSE